VIKALGKPKSGNTQKMLETFISQNENTQLANYRKYIYPRNSFRALID